MELNMTRRKRSHPTQKTRKPRTPLCPPAPDSKRATKRLAWLIQRALHSHDLDGELSRLAPIDRKFPRALGKAKDKNACYQHYLETLDEKERDRLAKAVETTDPDASDPDVVATGADLVRELPKIAWLWPG